MSLLKLRLPRIPHGAPPEPIRITPYGESGPAIWIDIVSTSSEWVEVHFIDETDAYDIVRNSILDQDEKATYKRKRWTPQRSKRPK
jgi:hypothetical protein